MCSMVKVSIIIPIFNTEKYIERCIQSITAQTLREIEIICVNDGSTDHSMAIINRYADNDSRIKIIEQENLMQGAARNAGMKIAQGEYIGFVDSDDYIDLDYYEKLYNTAKKYNSDIALAANIRIGNGKTKKRLNIKQEQFVTNLQDKFDINNQPKNPCPTNKIYKKELLDKNNITWPAGVYCEDRIFTLKAVYYANGVAAVPGINYYYFRNPDSTVKTRLRGHTKKLAKDKIQANRDVLNFLKSNNAEIRDGDFWAVTGYFPGQKFPILVKKESLHSKKYLLFNLILVFVRRDK